MLFPGQSKLCNFQPVSGMRLCVAPSVPLGNVKILIGGTGDRYRPCAFAL